MRELTPEEQDVIDQLGKAWNLFLELPTIHPSDNPEFAQSIHQAQNIVLARPALESIQSKAK